LSGPPATPSSSWRKRTASPCLSSNEAWRDKLLFCGTESGRNVDKVKKTGLTPVTTKSGNVWFEQARLMIECRKIAFTDLDPKHFLDPAIREFYDGPDYHRIYIGGIVTILSR